MAGETVVTMVGNVTRDPELRYTPSGVAVCKIGIASTERVLDRQSGEWKDKDPLFMDCTAWRDLAEHIAETITKGARIIVMGRLRLESWDDKTTGTKRSRMVLDVDEIGPSLKWATATVTKTQSTGDHSAGRSEGGFGSGNRRESAPQGGNSSFDSEPPF